LQDGEGLRLTLTALHNNFNLSAIFYVVQCIRRIFK